ncbi:MAG: hypothetical protein HYY76_07435 [Acidobacteria bacterium]|nr:hypothetical protein [Acidobacteriota bacterium]
MTSRRVNLAAAAATFVAVLTMAASSGAGQTPAAGTWTPPRTPDGQPDIQGFWANQGRRLATYNIQAMDGASETHTLISGVQSDARSLIVDPADGNIPYQLWAQAKRQDVVDNHNNPTKWEHVDPHTLCWVSGIPRMFYQGMFQILQIPGYVVVLQEFNHNYRVIHLDGRPHVPENLKLWMGDSRGRWEGNTLYVDVANKNDRTRFDIVGDFHSDAVRIRERFTVIDADTIRYEATFDDPTVYTRPFTMRLNLGRAVRGEEAKTYELMEEACLEGERNLPQMLFRLGGGRP